MALVGNRDLLRLAVNWSLSGRMWDHAPFSRTRKRVWMPSQYLELLGFIVDPKSGTFHVPPRRVDALKQLLDIIIAKDFRLSARTLSRLTGSLVSMSLASLGESNVQKHLSRPLMGSANLFVL